jgi:hypothetical protein
MRTVNFDMHDPYVTLGDIIAVLRTPVADTEWVVRPYTEPSGEESFDVASDGRDPLTLASESGRRVMPEDFAIAAKETPQIIWGTFIGYDGKRGSEPWLRIDVVDSSAFEISTDDAEVHRLIRASFKNFRVGRF